MPAYQDYISKSQLTRVVGELAAAKTAADAALFEGKTPVSDPKNTSTGKEDLGLAVGSGNDVKPRSNLLSAVTVTFTDNDSKIEGTLGGSANKDIVGTIVRQKRSVDGTWSCEVVAAGTVKGFKDKFIPTGCTKATS
ncbi:pilin [Moraxella nonliquefaciens]|uniref:pilin n=1 Tax=Moraxella nonliquefaciens TaxID=478 RepID=UPI0023B7B778|nr:pilin [Moraxella nonliquefaciens]